MKETKIIVVGGGAVGSFLAARLSKVTSVALVVHHATSNRFDEGLELQGSVTDRAVIPCYDWEEIERFPVGSIILVATKAFQLPEVLPKVKQRIGASSGIFLCQNGLGIADEANAIFAGQDYGRCILWFGMKWDGPARLAVSGEPRVELAGNSPEVVWELADYLTSVGVGTNKFASVGEVEWRKALWNITNNGLCALAQAPNGVAANDPRIRPLAEMLLEEAVTVARADGVKIEADYHSRVFGAIRDTASNLNSTLQDLRAGRPTEMPWLNGAVVNKAVGLGIPVPANLWVNNLVQFLETQGLKKKPTR